MSFKNRRFGYHAEDDLHTKKNVDGSLSYIFDPFNPLNLEITPEDVKEILKSNGIDIPINNFNLYRRAFVHRSYIKYPSAEYTNNNVTIATKPVNCLPLYTKSNERLEFIGDGILECITKYYLYRRFPKENEGFMTEKKITLVKNESIGKMAFDMGLHKWLIISKHTEEKQTRINLQKLGCLFESFIGALFLDFNKLSIEDDEQLFKNVFLTGPGFQVCQIFIESIFEKHVNWIKLICNDDNYKNILQVKIQREFKVTPDYMEINPYNGITGYHMGVYLCLGQSIHNLNHNDSISINQFSSFDDIHHFMSYHGKILIFLGEGKHKIKKKAEQIASMIDIFPTH
jgi:dsRNA-specific ribonuclease